MFTTFFSWFQPIINAFKTPDLRKKILYTFFILLIYRIGVAIPVPYIDAYNFSGILESNAGSMFEYLNLLSGSAFSMATLFALGISPYITSSIVMQLLTVAIPALERLQKEGPEGQKKIAQITRYVTVALALITSYGYYMMLSKYGLLTVEGFFPAIIIVTCYCAGSAIVMWLGERINEKGIGNGISIILFANIVSGSFDAVTTIRNYFGKHTLMGYLTPIIAIIIGIAMIYFIVFITESERRLPIVYAKRVIGRKMYGGQNSNLPIKLNMSGVMPVIFANSILAIPATLAMIITPKDGSFWDKTVNFLSSNSWFYPFILFVLIIAFGYFYITISFNPIEVANNLKNNGGSIPGIRPGRPTAEYITRVLNKITLIGSLFLSVVAIAPIIANIITDHAISGIAFGGTSLLIVVGVALETARDLAAQMSIRGYRGFLQ
ncbi:MAG TPA: preprotein translocase subunit SecY [Bacillota bacterium]|mgnify:FL=1|nr:preprotein translocase subunit SecY [Clostridiales bacterium]HPU17353.1 preprotein translocase subunit SecY [Bacillota bacterium]